MTRIRDIVIVMCTLVLAVGSASAGINSKEVGALLIYPEYWATGPLATYITISNDMTTDVTAHIEVIGGEQCGDCNFELPLTGQQTKRLLFQATPTAPTVDIYDSSDWEDFPFPGELLRTCAEQKGFVVVSIEEAHKTCAKTLTENRLHGDLVVINYPMSDSWQEGAIAVQGGIGGTTNGDRHLEFNNIEYAAFPSILTANFWAEQPPSPLAPYPAGLTVTPTLVLFNVNRRTADPVIKDTHCDMTFVDAKERPFSNGFNFKCWLSKDLTSIDPGTKRIPLGTENGYFWLRCDPGTHGALNTFHDATLFPFPYAPATSLFGDTLFQSVTRGPDATLWMTPRVSCGES